MVRLLLLAARRRSVPAGLRRRPALPVARCPSPLALGFSLPSPSTRLLAAAATSCLFAPPLPPALSLPCRSAFSTRAPRPAGSEPGAHVVTGSVPRDVSCLSLSAPHLLPSRPSRPSPPFSAVVRDGVSDHHNVGCRPGRKRGVRPNQWRCQMAELGPPAEGILLAHFIVSDDVERSRRFYTEVLGGRVVFSGRGRPTSHCPTAGSSSMAAEARPTTSRRSPWRRHATPTGSAASSISGSKTSRPCTPNGAPEVLNS